MICKILVSYLSWVGLIHLKKFFLFTIFYNFNVVLSAVSGISKSLGQGIQFNISLYYYY